MRALVNVHTGPSESPPPTSPHTSAPGEPQPASELGGGGAAPGHVFPSPPPGHLGEGHWLSARPGIWGRCRLQLMLLCSMLNEARTFTQVTFTAPLSTPLSCERREPSGPRRGELSGGNSGGPVGCSAPGLPRAGAAAHRPPRSFRRCSGLSLPDPVPRAGRAGTGGQGPGAGRPWPREGGAPHSCSPRPVSGGKPEGDGHESTLGGSCRRTCRKRWPGPWPSASHRPLFSCSFVTSF